MAGFLIAMAIVLAALALAGRAVRRAIELAQKRASDDTSWSDD